jgi:hypothetical protein
METCWGAQFGSVGAALPRPGLSGSVDDDPPGNRWVPSPGRTTVSWTSAPRSALSNPVLGVAALAVSPGATRPMC